MHFLPAEGHLLCWCQDLAFGGVPSWGIPRTTDQGASWLGAGACGHPLSMAHRGAAYCPCRTTRWGSCSRTRRYGRGSSARRCRSWGRPSSRSGRRCRRGPTCCLKCIWRSIPPSCPPRTLRSLQGAVTARACVCGYSPGAVVITSISTSDLSESPSLLTQLSRRIEYACIWECP